MALLPAHQHGRPSQQTPSHPTPAASFSPTRDASALGYPIDPSAAAKQMAALNAVGLARMAQTGRGPSASSSSGGPTSAGLLGGMPSLNQQHSPPSVTGHDPFSPQGRSFQAHTPGLSNSLPPNLNVNPQAGINVPPTDPVLAMAAQMASSNPSPQMIQTFNNKKRQFLIGLASIHATP
ncbi:hypothetical protein EVG20_g113 [Dentipellis fragilis]|uniref:Uncharacterized protein n=1 Tax=Dentipellis fragilis TaxID=205917 RepID=A0A4Y9ZDI2_9AGAM|nr:hypothetical protein EVG20_g113 [Dentipellis fragilis]